MITTLKGLCKQHPEWANLPLVIYCPDGHYDWVGGAGAVYKAETCLKAIDNGGECKGKACGCDNCTDAEKIDVLVFAPN